MNNVQNLIIAGTLATVIIKTVCFMCSPIIKYDNKISKRNLPKNSITKSHNDRCI